MHRFLKTRWCWVVLLFVMTYVGCSSQRGSYGVVSFGPCPDFRRPHSFMKDLNIEGKTPVILRFCGPSGAYLPAGFLLQVPSGDEIGPLCYYKIGNIGWKRTIHFTNGTAILINQVSGDIDIELLYMINGSPSTKHTLIYHDKPKKIKYKIPKRAIKQ